ncbi:hypothetical protein GCM10028825_17390 [Spirosoma agri]
MVLSSQPDNTDSTSKLPMNITQVREHLHRLIDEVDDIYVLNGLYRTLVSDKRQRDEYEREQAQEKTKNQARSGSKSN